MVFAKNVDLKAGENFTRLTAREKLPANLPYFWPALFISIKGIYIAKAIQNRMLYKDKV